MKRCISFLLAVVLLLSVMPTGLFSLTANAATSGYYTYTVSNGKATITSCSTSISGAITIPSTLGSYPVTGIGDSAFFDCYRLTSVTIPDSVTSIGNSAFDECYSLTSISIPDSVTSIGNYAFCNCDSLTSVTIPDSVTSIGNYAFSCCNRLTSVTIPDSVTSIGVNVFAVCSSLEYNQNDNGKYLGNATNPYVVLCDTVSSSIKSIEIHESTKVIYGHAFESCNSLTNVTIPDSVTSIGDYAFSDCSSLTSVTIGDGTTSIGDYVFYECSSLTSVTIPDSVTSIGDYAFDRCYSLTSVTIPDSVTSIGNGAFYHCRSLTSVTIGNGVTSIGDWAFDNCEGLTSVTIGNGVTSIGDWAFDHCYRLTSVTIPDSVTSIGNGAFYYCNGLTSVTIGDGVTSIGDYAFSDCSSLTSVTIPDSVTSIGGSAFGYCGKLQHVWYSGSEKYRNDLVIGSGNEHLENATWHYNCCNPDSHVYDNACDAACNSCNYVRTVPDHVYTNICDADCNECGAVRSNAHAYDHDCDAVCNICGYERADIHVYETSCDTTCNECGAVRSITHTYDYICDNTCNICGYKRNASHIYDGADDVTCNVCKQPLAPAAPEVESVTDTTVILVAVAGYEYSKDGTTWQKSNVFTGLQPNYSYRFYQRIAETEENLASPASSPLSVTTDKHMPATPAAPTVESKTSTSVTLKSRSGYEYSKDGEIWQESPVFSNLSPGTQYTFYQRIAPTSNSFASNSSQPITVTTLQMFMVSYDANGGTYATDVQMKDQGVALVLSDQVPEYNGRIFKGWATTPYGEPVYQPADTYDKDEDIILYAVWVQNCYKCGGKGQTFVACSLCDGSGIWVGNISRCCYSRTVFVSITHGPSGYFCVSCEKLCNVQYGSADCVKTVPHLCDPCSGAGYFKTTPPAAPKPELLSATSSSITVVAQDGMEYSLDGINWQESNTFDGLAPDTQYTIYQRYAETSTHLAGLTSEPLIVRTDAPPYTPGDVNDDGKINSLDGLQLLRHLNNWNIKINSKEAMDVNADGKVNSLDGLILMRYLNGWNVTLG